MRMCHSLKNVYHKQTYVFVLKEHMVIAQNDCLCAKLYCQVSHFKVFICKSLPILQIEHFVTTTEETNGDAFEHNYSSLGFSL